MLHLPNSSGKSRQGLSVRHNPYRRGYQRGVMVLGHQKRRDHGRDQHGRGKKARRVLVFYGQIYLLTDGAYALYHRA